MGYCKGNTLLLPEVSLSHFFLRWSGEIGIDEFAVRNGHVYKTIVVDLDGGRVIYVGTGKGMDALVEF